MVLIGIFEFMAPNIVVPKETKTGLSKCTVMVVLITEYYDLKSLTVTHKSYSTPLFVRLTLSKCTTSKG